MRDGLPCAGAPVYVGVMDAWAGMFGVGVTRNGDAMYLSGTSEVLGMVSWRQVPTPGVIVFPAYRGIMLHAAPTQSGGASLDWLSALLAAIADEHLEPRSRHAAFRFDPAVPAASPGRAGAALGYAVARRFRRLDATTGPGELSRAVMEGVAFSARLALEAAESSADWSPIA